MNKVTFGEEVPSGGNQVNDSKESPAPHSDGTTTSIVPTTKGNKRDKVKPKETEVGPNHPCNFLGNKRVEMICQKTKKKIGECVLSASLACCMIVKSTYASFSNLPDPETNDPTTNNIVMRVSGYKTNVAPVLSLVDSGANMGIAGFRRGEGNGKYADVQGIDNHLIHNCPIVIQYATIAHSNIRRAVGVWNQMAYIPSWESGILSKCQMEHYGLNV